MTKQEKMALLKLITYFQQALVTLLLIQEESTLIQLLKNLVDYSRGYIGVDDEGWAVLVSFNFYYRLLEAMAIQGSDKAYSDVVNGELTRVAGLPIVPIIYLDNKIAVSEEEYTENNQIKRRPIEEDFTGVDAILFYKNVFAYKLTNPIFKVQEITGSPDQLVFTHE